MRRLLAVLIVSFAATAAPAKNRTFIVVSNPDGYGIDRCLAAGAACGAAMATALCRARDFKQALSFRRVDRDEITGAVPADLSACTGGSCLELVAIECGR